MLKLVPLGLRPERRTSGYSANRIIDITEAFLSKALRGTYPIEVDLFERYSISNLPKQFNSLEEVVTILEPHIELVNELIKKAEK